MNNQKIQIYTDGASRGNPGAAAWAYLILKNGTIVTKESDFLGTTTNNVAEYNAVIHALQAAKNKGYKKVEIYSDSELVIKQITGQYQVRKAHLRLLWEKIKQLQSCFEYTEFNSVRRSDRYISVADQMCNETLDRQRNKYNLSNQVSRDKHV